MKVYKFGGASVKDTQGLKRVAEILKSQQGQVIVVVSAMAKTTNALEKLVPKMSESEAEKLITEIEAYHYSIAQESITGKWKDKIIPALQKVFEGLRTIVKEYPTDNYDERYDQVVSYGELLSNYVVSAFLSDEGIPHLYIDARRNICTDDHFRDARVNFAMTEKCLQLHVPIAFENADIILTHGFIGRTSTGKTTTLGREGSDYTAAIIAWCTDAESVTIWKDVPGVLNADPKKFADTIKLDHISYQDAIELAYYGATVIHPKTIKPLQNKNIPLFFKPFGDYTASGTIIDNDSSPLPVPCYISKTDQVLLSLSPKDFSFIAEENLSLIFDCFAKHHVKVNMMQHSAINFSVCIDNAAHFSGTASGLIYGLVRADPRVRPDATMRVRFGSTHGIGAGSTHVSTPTTLLDELRNNYRVLYNENVELFTIRYYDQPTIDKITKGRNVLLEQRSRYTVQLVVK